MKKEKYFGMSPRIARWKLDTPIENWLSYRADHSERWKYIYLFYYNLFDHKYYTKGKGMAKKVIQSHVCSDDIKDTYAVVLDMLYCLHRFGFSFENYCTYDFAHNKDLEYRSSFVADKLRYHYCDILNSKKIFEIMTDKYACYQHYGKYFKRTMIGCYSEKDRDGFNSFVNHHTSFIYKPIEEHSGHGVEIFNCDKIVPNVFFDNKLANGAFVIEELIEQGEELARMHPNSVNSCRVLTFTLGKKVEIIGTTWRVGAGNAIVDNAGSGGMYASINPKTGIVETDAINFRGLQFEKHPDTGVQFRGFQMPLWNEAILLVKEMASLISGSTLISWDIAYSNKGWVMVEANENGGWNVIQSNKKIGLKQQLFGYMDEFFKNSSL